MRLFFVIFGFVDYEAVVKLAEEFNGADLRNVCTEAGKYTHFFTIMTIFKFVQLSNDRADN